jgi:CDP-diacylglycerol--glycerol-3-phosphate 3-phosphatidyltransferase
MINKITKTEDFLTHIDSYRDRFLFLFIKPYWPRKITPNQVSFVRVACGIIIFILLFFFKIENWFLIFPLFCLGVITDLIDGPIARGTNQVTEFGAMLDSTADRILIIPIAVYSLFGMHKWLLLFLLLAEIINALSAIFYKSKEVYLESNIFGKIKMTLQSIVFIVILMMWPNPPFIYFVWGLWATIPITLLSIFTRVLELNNKGHIKSEIIKKQLNKYDKT